MQQENKKIILQGHGSGGRMMHDLIRQVFMKHLTDPALALQGDAAVLSPAPGHLAFSTDGYVVQPLFFPGGNIGKLAVCGTVNDLTAMGATPYYLSASFILEEGLELTLLEEVVISMARTAVDAGIRIVCGDTKVVGKGQCDRLFISTSGIGWVKEGYERLAGGETIRPGDHVILTGTIGDHGMAVLAARNQLGLASPVVSDCAPLNAMVQPLLEAGMPLRFMRDPTRGGLATVLCEVTEGKPFGIRIRESLIPVSEPVRGMCETYGFDPLYIANEGKMVMIAPADVSEDMLRLLQDTKEGKNAVKIGEVVDAPAGKVLMDTGIGGSRIITMMSGEQLPRIC